MLARHLPILTIVCFGASSDSDIALRTAGIWRNIGPCSQRKKCKILTVFPVSLFTFAAQFFIMISAIHREVFKKVCMSSFNLIFIFERGFFAEEER